MQRKAFRQTTPTESGRILFIGSGYQFARRTLEALAEGQTVKPDEKEFLERFMMANGLLMVTHNAWAGRGWGVAPFAHLVYNNSHFHDLLKEAMPFERGQILPRIRAVWPGRVAEIFADVAGSDHQQRKLSQLACRHRPIGEVYGSIAQFLGQTDAAGQEFVWGRLMHARFMLADHLLPKPDLSQANAAKLLEAWKSSKQPNTNPTDEMGVPLFHMRTQKEPGLA
jgi:hypothetical protein